MSRRFLMAGVATMAAGILAWMWLSDNEAACDLPALAPAVQPAATGVGHASGVDPAHPLPYCRRSLAATSSIPIPPAIRSARGIHSTQTA
jgi:hypothetical protein